MALLMIALAIIITYPVFIVFVYGLSNLLFTNIEKVEEQQRKEKLILMIKARRVRKVHRFAKLEKKVKSFDRGISLETVARYKHPVISH